MAIYKKKSIFTDAELKAMRLADEEIEKKFRLTPEDIRHSEQIDKAVRYDRLDNKGKKIADYQAAYREANKDKIADQKAAYYQANKDKRNAYQREYRRRKKILALQEHEKAALDAANIQDGIK